MKKISNIFISFGLGSLALLNTSCLDETVPNNYATSEQIAGASMATEALAAAMPQYFNAGEDDYHYQFAYGAMMRIRDVCTGDFVVTDSGYDWFTQWEENQYLGRDYAAPGYIWRYYYKHVLTTTNLLGAISDPESALDDVKGYYGAASAFRAMLYLDLARMYEFLPVTMNSDEAWAGASGVNEDGNEVVNLTVPIVSESLSMDDSRNNPRATREEMKAFIENDLDNAEKYIGYLPTSSNTYPHLDAVYGLKARLYMWVEDYAKAEEYARKAIEASNSHVMTEAECLDTKTGFNDLSKWMWGSQQVAEDFTVQTGIINWTSWMSNETTFGYAGASNGPYVQIDAHMYNRMSNTDFRKKMYKAPSGTELDGATPWINYELVGANLPDYSSVKFRPNAGNMEEYTVGAASAYPVMRIEEMYFIEAEAAAQQSPSKGKSLIKDFMQTYRDPNYDIYVSSKEDVVEEIVFQKRVELWGEGQSFFDIKRLDYPVTRGYIGTNYTDKLAIFNTAGRPAWMNFVIVRSEGNNNEAVQKFNNPDPSDKCKTVDEQNYIERKQ